MKDEQDDPGVSSTHRHGLDKLANAARQTKRYFDRQMTSMTPEQASFVRRLRVDEGYTWRAVADACALAWHGEWDSHQLAGMAICERAATFTAEHYMRPPWN